MPYAPKRPPSVTVFGSAKHKQSVKNLYRYCLKWAKYSYRFNYNSWDWFAYNCRNEFERCKDMKDPGEVNQVMKECFEQLQKSDDLDRFSYGWDGPTGVSFLRYPTGLPKSHFDHRVGYTTYDPHWRDWTTDEYYSRKEVEKWIARYVIVFREQAMAAEDYAVWLSHKKRLEDELRTKVDDIRRTMNKSMWDYLFDWPYNAVNSFSDGWQPNLSLDQAFQDHWDEELWYKMAELTPDERDLVRTQEWKDHASLRSIDRLLPGGKSQTGAGNEQQQ